MRHSIIVLLLLFVQNLTSQIEIGTKWVYSEQNFQYLHPVELKVIADTLIDSKIWYKLNEVGGCARDFDDVLIREEEDKIFIIHESFGQEHILYDYSLEAGDSYEVPVPGSNHRYMVSIDSVSTIEVGGQDFKVQYTNNIDFGSVIVEGIGSTSFLFPQGEICDPHYVNIRCFETGSTFVDFDLENDCYDTVFLASEKTILRKQNFVIYPNPFSEKLSVEYYGFTDAKIRLSDILGRTINEEFLQSGNYFELNAANLRPGTYVVEIRTSNGTSSRRVVKE